MASRTALVLETNPVITERYLDYTHDSDWRIMLKDTLNDFLEKLQHEKFNLIVAEESLLPQAIIQMMKSTGIPFLLSTNNKNPEIPTLPRNFNRTELLTVFGRLVPEIQEEQVSGDTVNEDDTVNDLLSGLEDEEETFELTSDAVVAEPEKPHEEKDTAEDPAADFFGEGDLFGDEEKTQEKPEENNALSDTLKPTIDVSEKEKSRNFTPPSFNDKDMDSFISSLSLEKEEEKPAFERIIEEEPTLKTAVETQKNNTDNDSDMLFGDETEAKPFTAEEETKPELSDDVIKAEVSAWLEKNARSIIKEIVLEQLASLSGKNND